MTAIRLLVSDVDGTLVTRDKRLTPATRAAVGRLRSAGIHFSVTSSRPGFGMRTIIDTLKIDLPVGPFNGSSIVNPDLTVMEEQRVPQEAVERSLALFKRHGIDIWIFTNDTWVIRRDGPYVDHERRTIATEPFCAADDRPYHDRACKVVGVSDDFPLLERVEGELQAKLGDLAHAVRSQNYYLDVTPPGANKGSFVTALARRLGVPREAVATLGDMPNDVPMFKASGLSYAMGNAAEAVKREASRVTASNEDDGFASAVDEILARGSTLP
jgi:hypothetical protein